MHKHKLEPNQYHYCPTIDTALTLSRAVIDNIDAQFDMSILLETGYGCELDLEKSFMWCEKAALARHPIAQYYLGNKYLSGTGVKINTHMAYLYIKESAKQDYPDALYVLALMYNHGEYIEEDQEKSEKLIRRAAMLGHAEARNIEKDIDNYFDYDSEISTYSGDSLSDWDFEDINITHH